MNWGCGCGEITKGSFVISGGKWEVKWGLREKGGWGVLGENLGC